MSHNTTSFHGYSNPRYLQDIIYSLMCMTLKKVVQKVRPAANQVFMRVMGVPLFFIKWYASYSI